MNATIKAIATGGSASAITSSADALSCLRALISNFRETVADLHSLGLIRSEEELRDSITEKAV